MTARSSTLLGTFGHPPLARLDERATLLPADAPWSLDWAVGAEDRWYQPRTEPTVRQHRHGVGPVIETNVRIPGGDARHTAYGAVVGGRPATVVEMGNESAVPIALAVIVRPSDPGGRPVRADVDGSIVGFGPGQPRLTLPRPPHDLGAPDGLDLDAEPAVVAVYPLPHRTTLRFAIADADVDLGAAPAADAVARGWAGLVEAGGRFVFGDPGLGQRHDAARARLLLAAPYLPDELVAFAPGAGLVLDALAVGGHRSEVEPAVAALTAAFPTTLNPNGGPRAGAEVVAGAARAATLGLATVTGQLVEVGAQIAHLVDRAGEPDAATIAKRALADLADLGGDPTGAAHLRRDLPAAAVRSSLDDIEALTSADDAANDAARLVIAGRELLVDDSGDGVDLVPGHPVAWRGGTVEAHDIATRHGRLSFAIRWHGPRPALLWQLDGVTGTAIRCSGLDPDWSTTDQRGETLLAGAADGLAPTPGPGDSFL